MCRIGPMDHHLITIANLLQILAFSGADKGIKSNLEVLSNNDFYTITFYIGFQVNDDVLELSESNEIRKIKAWELFLCPVYGILDNLLLHKRYVK